MTFDHCPFIMIAIRGRWELEIATRVRWDGEKSFTLLLNKSDRESKSGHYSQLKAIPFHCSTKAWNCNFPIQFHGKLDRKSVYYILYPVFIDCVSREINFISNWISNSVGNGCIGYPISHEIGQENCISKLSYISYPVFIDRVLREINFISNWIFNSVGNGCIGYPVSHEIGQENCISRLSYHSQSSPE